MENPSAIAYDGPGEVFSENRKFNDLRCGCSFVIAIRNWVIRYIALGIYTIRWTGCIGVGCGSWKMMWNALQPIDKNNYDVINCAIATDFHSFFHCIRHPDGIRQPPPSPPPLMHSLRVPTRCVVVCIFTVIVNIRWAACRYRLLAVGTPFIFSCVDWRSKWKPYLSENGNFHRFMQMIRIGRCIAQAHTRALDVSYAKIKITQPFFLVSVNHFVVVRRAIKNDSLESSRSLEHRFYVRSFVARISRTRCRCKLFSTSFLK